MWEGIKRFLLPPVFEDQPEKTNNAIVVHNFLATILILTILFPLVSTFLGQTLGSTIRTLVWTLIIVTVLSGVILHLGYVVASGAIVCLTLWAIFSFAAYNFGGLHDTVLTGLFLVIVLSSLLGSWQVLTFFTGISLVSLAGIYILEQEYLIQPEIPVPADASDVVLPAVFIIGIALTQRRFVNYLTSAYDEIRASAVSFEQTNLELEKSQDELRQQAQELERRTRYLEATSVVARDIISELDPETLLRRVAILITDQFEFYHTGLFLIEPGGEHAVLKAASSRGGQRMLARGHRLRVGEEGIVGFVASQGRSRIALDTGVDAVFFDNPDLPETRSEAALPLRVRSEVIGVLDVQSTEAEAFGNEDIAVLQTLADQIAIALQTAQLFQQVDESLVSQRRAYGEISREAWERLTKEQQTLGYHYIQGDIVPVSEYTIATESKLPEISLPLEIGGQVVGYITAHKPEEQMTWSTDEISIMQTLSNQLSVALESARLYQDTQQRAAREQLTGEVASRIRETLDIESILKTASEEIRRALNLPEVVIRLGEPVSSQTQGGAE